MTDITVDSNVLSTLVAKSLLESIEPEQKELMVEQALKYLITKPNSSYASTSPLQDAFNSAVHQTSFSVVRDILQEEEFEEAIRNACREALMQLLKDKNSIKQAIVSGLANYINDTFTW